MKSSLRLLAFLAAATSASAQDASTTRTAALRIRLGETLELQRSGATAAYAIDETLVECTLDGEHLRLRGRRHGSTHVAIVTSSGVLTLEIVVDDPPSPTSHQGTGKGMRSSFQTGFDSQTGRVTTSLDAASRSGSRTIGLHLENVTRTEGASDRRATTSLPRLALSLDSAGRSLTLGDLRSDVSPLTLADSTLRGAHWSSERLQLHAGWSSATLYEDLVLPSEREGVFGGTYRLRRGTSQLLPSVYYFPSVSPYGGGHGALASLLYRYGRPEGRFVAEAELAYGGKASAAGELSYRGPRLQGRLEGRHQPAGVASLGLGRPHGTFVEADASAQLARTLSTVASFSLDRNESLALAHHSDSGSAELRYAPSRQFHLRGGLRVGAFDVAGGGPAARTFTLPVEVAWDGPHAGVSALYRYQERSDTGQRGSGGRIGGHFRLAQFQATAYADVQPTAASVELVLQGHPELARALAELGLSLQTPDDLARLLRDNSLLVDLGLLHASGFGVDASRQQAGLDLTWSPGSKQRFRGHLLADRTRVAGESRTTVLATLEYSRTVAGLEVLAGVSLYTRGGAAGRIAEPSFRVGLRRRFDGLPGLPRFGRRALTGLVFRDDAADGRPTLGSGIAGAEVRLEDGRRALTDATGRFRFDDPGAGSHRVEATLLEGAYFTTPSSVHVAAGADAAFGLAFTPARLDGTVRDDAGVGVPGVRLRLSREAFELFSTTDGAGRFAFALADGDYELALAPASLPPGYAERSGGTRPILLRRGAPERAEIRVFAQRSVAGRVLGAQPDRALVCLQGESRCTHPGADGRYVIRGVEAGAHTLTAAIGPRSASRSVDIPRHPGAVGGIDLDPR